MKHPPYHLRPNKAVDRFMLIEVLLRVRKAVNLSEYTYYGLGGPYLEEFRLLSEFCPEVKLVSIEEDHDTYKRQRFHLPCRNVRLRNSDFKSFLSQFNSRDRRSVFWLDYTRLEYSAFEDFMSLLGKVATGSILKITLPAEPRDYSSDEKRKEFRARFGEVLPNPWDSPPVEAEQFAYLVQGMLQVAAQRALPSAVGRIFQPLSSFYYADGVGMFTLTGIVCLIENVRVAREWFRGWPFANLNWRAPRRIDVPFLSTKERLHLQKHLPCGRHPGRTLTKALGYIIDEDRRRSHAKMKQYADFYRYFPHFVRAIP
jgi:hypothetical protein